MNSVIGFAHLLLARPELAGEVRLYGERIRAAGKALLTVVDDILDFSRIEAGVIELSPAPFSMRASSTNASPSCRGKRWPSASACTST